MSRRLGALLMLGLMAIGLPSAGASWAYCLRTGTIHPAGGDCCCQPAADHGGCDGCAGDHRDEQGHDCCVDAGKMLPEALASVADIPNTAPQAMLSAVVPGPVNLRGPSQPEALRWQSRAPPPGPARYLCLLALRL